MTVLCSVLILLLSIYEKNVHIMQKQKASAGPIASENLVQGGNGVWRAFDPLTD